MVDTGAASTAINADFAAEAGVYVSPADTLRRPRGVGGHEHAFTRHVDRLAIGDRGVDQFEVEVGEMDYGFEIGGMLACTRARLRGSLLKSSITACVT